MGFWEIVFGSLILYTESLLVCALILAWGAWKEAPSQKRRHTLYGACNAWHLCASFAVRSRMLYTGMGGKLDRCICLILQHGADYGILFLRHISGEHEDLLDSCVRL